MSVILEHKSHLKYSIQNGSLDQLFDFFLHTISEDSYLYKKLIRTYSRHQDLMPHKINETMPIDIIQIEEKRIHLSLLEIINKLKQIDIQADVQVNVSYVKE